MDASAFELWLEKLTLDYSSFILPVTESVTEQWGHMMAARSLPVIAGLLAATAHVFQLTIATRNISDFPDHIPVFNPWETSGKSN